MTKISKDNNAPDEPRGLSDAQIAAEEKFMKGVPYFNIGALLMPPIWGPGHGTIITILFYPLWLFCDNVLFAAYSAPSFLSVGTAIIVFALMLAVTLVYGRLAQPQAWHRAYSRGKTKEQYLKEERYWAIGMAVVAVIFLAGATWYNLTIRAPFAG